MGLDMSLYAHRYMGLEDDSIIDELKKFVTIPFHDAKLNNIRVEVMYWRKANAIHNWFVNNCIDGVEWCKYTEVLISQLVELKDICKEVIDHSALISGKIIEGYTYTKSASGEITENVDMKDGYVILDPTFAKEHLPVADGFLFGSTDYDQYYYENIVYTYEGLNAILSVAPIELRNWEFLYKAIW